jgi:hypothetical protein
MAWLARWWRGSEVRMKRSYEIQDVAHLLGNSRDISSANSSVSRPSRARRLGHLQAMLVGAGLEAHVAALGALEAGDGVGGDRFIGVADVRRPLG